MTVSLFVNRRTIFRRLALAMVAVMLANFLSMLPNSHMHGTMMNMGKAPVQMTSMADHDSSPSKGNPMKSMEECGMASCSLVLPKPLGDTARAEISQTTFGLKGVDFTSQEPSPLPRPPKFMA